MKYKVFFEEKAAKELAKINKPYQILIKKKIEQLASDFESLGSNLKPLKGQYDYFRLRVGNYRVIFHKEIKKLIIVIVRISHRKSIYKDID